MATNTTNYNLKKPAQDDFYNVDDFNGNADKIDTHLKANADAISTANTNITATNTSIAAVKATADAALPATNFTGANILSKMAGAGSVLPIANGGTGAADLTGFVQTYNGYGSSIFGGNLNDWKTAGTYSTNGNVSSTTSSGYVTYNYPSEWTSEPWATITVDAKKDGSGVTQTLWFWNDSSKNIYVRTYGSSAWSIWVKIATSGNLASLVQSLLTGGSVSVIKSIQRGTITISGGYTAAATISSVNTSKASIKLLGGVTGGDATDYLGRVELTNSTTVTAYRGNQASSASIIGFEVVEYH